MMKAWLRNWNGAHTWAYFLAVSGLMVSYLASPQGASVAAAMHISGAAVVFMGVLVAACAKSLNAPRGIPPVSIKQSEDS